MCVERLQLMGCQPMPTFLQDFLGLTAVATRQARNAAFLQSFPSP